MSFKNSVGQQPNRLKLQHMSLTRLFNRLVNGKCSKVELLLRQPLFRFKPTGDIFRMADAIDSMLITGGVGSGKTSGAGQHILLAYLRALMGALIICVKSDEAQRVIELIRRAGRSADLLVFNKESNLSFGFLEYELNRLGNGALEIQNAVNMLMQLYQTAKQYKAGSQSDSNDKFWDDSLERAITNSIELLILAKEPVTVLNMRKIISSAFKENDLRRYKDIWSVLRNPHVADERKEEEFQSFLDWQQENYFLHCFERANKRTDFAKPEQEAFEFVAEYWMSQFPSMSDKTTAIVVESYLSLVAPFMSGILRSHFSGGFSHELNPENLYQLGKIIVLDFPVKEYGLSGIYAASIVKLVMQQAMERRKPQTEDNPRAVCLWIDEYQNVVSPSYDGYFILAARSCLVANVLTTQSINGIIAAMGKQTPTEKAKALLANLGTKIFCSNACHDTNTWASQLIGQEYVDTVSMSTKDNGMNGRTYNQSQRAIIPPEYFGKLRTGKRENKYKVDTIVFKAGKIWKSGRNILKATFDQRS